MIGVVRSGYTLHVKNFDGPLDLLLELIHGSKLVVTDISLSDITDQYLMYLKTMQLFNIDIASEFFVIAASLVYIKTKRLLPNTKEDDNEILDEKELLNRLKEYKKFRYLARFLWQKKEEGNIYYSRDYQLTNQGTQKQTEVEEVLIGDLIQSIRRYRGAFIKKAIPIKRREVSVEEKMEMIMNILSVKKMVKFSELAVMEKNKVDRVASFLGGLELSFRQKVLLRQLKLFSDFDIVRKEERLI